MTRGAPVCACGRVAECSLPEPLCQFHAAEFYQTLVRVGAALAQLQAVAPSCPQWIPLQPAADAPRRRQRCRRCTLNFGTRRRYATLCPNCLSEINRFAARARTQGGRGRRGLRAIA